MKFIANIMLAGLMIMSALVPVLPAQSATRHEVGIATSATLLRMSDKKLEQRLTDIQDLGAVWIRVDFSWPVIQPHNASDYDWSMYDRVVRAAGRHHLKVLATLTYTAPWAQEPRCAQLVKTEAAGQKCNPYTPETFARFARAAALRYKHQPIRAWEIWNEPNLSAYHKTVQAHNAVFVDPREYAELANAAATEIRHNDPDSVIITGGLAPMFEAIYPKGMRQSDYLAALLPHLKASLFDGIAIHPYSWPVLPSKPADYNAFYTVDKGRPKYNLRDVMAAAGWGKKEIWGTEYGASTKGLRPPVVGRPTAANRPDHVTEQDQAQLINQGIKGWYAKANVGPLFVHSDSDQWLKDRKNEGGFGLRRADGSKKPAYEAFRQATRQSRQ